MRVTKSLRESKTQQSIARKIVCIVKKREKNVKVQDINES